MKQQYGGSVNFVMLNVDKLTGLSELPTEYTRPPTADEVEKWKSIGRIRFVFAALGLVLRIVITARKTERFQRPISSWPWGQPVSPPAESEA